MYPYTCHYESPEEENHMVEYWIKTGCAEEEFTKEKRRYQKVARERERKRWLIHQKNIQPTYESVTPCEPSDLVAGLTEREEAAWRLRAEGWSYEEIARGIGCATSTIPNLLDSIQKKATAAGLRP